MRARPTVTAFRRLHAPTWSRGAALFLFAFLLAIPLFLATARDTTLAIIPRSPSAEEPPPAAEAPPAPATSTLEIPSATDTQSATATQPVPEAPPALEEPAGEPQHLLTAPPETAAPVSPEAPQEPPAAATAPLETPATDTVTAPEAPPQEAVPSAPPSRYSVRTRSFLNRADLDLLEQSLRDAGYFPHVEEEKVKGEADTLYFIGLGAFPDLAAALPLFKELRAEGIPVFLYSTGEPLPPEGAPILPPALAEQFFPELGGDAVDSLELVMLVAEGRRAAPPPEIKPAIAPKEEGISAPVFTSQPPGRAVQPIESPVRKRLRDMAWQMREKGYSVFLEGETELSPEGVLVGVFDTEADAADLADELGSYGYDMRVMKETRDGTRYYVYVETKDAAPPGTVATTDEGTPQAEDPFDFLLDMTLPR